MDEINDSLVLVGSDSIKDLYEFIADLERKMRETNRFYESLLYSRILGDLEMAIVSYTGNKAKKEK